MYYQFFKHFPEMYGDVFMDFINTGHILQLQFMVYCGDSWYIFVMKLIENGDVMTFINVCATFNVTYNNICYCSLECKFNTLFYACNYITQKGTIPQ